MLHAREWDRALIYFSIRSVWSCMRFMLGNSTIRYICDTNHLNILCIILYFDISPFFKHYFYYSIYAIILISLQCAVGTSRCILFVILNTFVILMNNKPRLFTVVIWLYRIIRQQERANVAPSWSTYTKVSAINWYSYYYYFVYRN